MGKTLRVLLIEDNEDDSILMLDELRAGDYDLIYRRVETAEELSAALMAQPWDVVLSDYRLPGLNAPAAVEILKQHRVDVPFIILSGAVEEETAVAALKAGAHDFVRKEKLARLLPAVEREVAERDNRENGRRAIQALQASEERFRSLAHSATDGIICTDACGRIVFWNPAATRLFCYAEEEALQKPLTSFVTSQDLIRATIDTPSVTVGRTIETKGIRKDGTYIPLELSLSSWALGTDIFYTAILRDISERQKLEATMSHLASIVAFSDDAIVSQDLECRVLSWNRAAERIYGYKADEMIGQSIKRLIPEHKIKEAEEILNCIKQGQGIQHYESVRICKDGSEKTMSLTISPLQDQEGQVIGVSKIGRDMTARTQMEEALRRAHAELERRVEERTNELSTANDALKDKLEELESFHDMVVGRELKMIALEQELKKRRSAPSTE